MKSKQLENLIFFLIVPIYFINPFYKGFLFGYLAILLIWFNKIHIKIWDNEIVVLGLFSLCYSLFYIFDLTLGSQFIFMYLILPITFYIIGKLIANRFDSTSLFKVLLLLGFLFSLPSLLSVFQAISTEGFVTIKRDVEDIWYGETNTATYTAGFFLLNMSIPALLFTTRKKMGLKYSIVMILVFLLTITCVLRLGSRTHLGISIITLLASIVFLVSKQSMIKNLFLFIFLFILTNFAFAYFSFDKDSDVFSAYADRMDSKTHGASSAGGRTERWVKSIEYLQSDPLGWRLEEFGYSHNLWFDVGRIGGVISFLLLIAFSLLSFRNLLRVLRFKNELFVGSFCLIYTLAFNLLFLVEPVFEGFFHVFVFYCLLCGIIKQLTVINSNK